MQRKIYDVASSTTRSSTLKNDFGTNQLCQETKVFDKTNLEVWKLFYYNGNIKTWTNVFCFVFCIHMHSFKWFCLIA